MGEASMKKLQQENRSKESAVLLTDTRLSLKACLGLTALCPAGYLVKYLLDWTNAASALQEGGVLTVGVFFFLILLKFTDLGMPHVEASKEGLFLHIRESDILRETPMEAWIPWPDIDDIVVLPKSGKQGERLELHLDGFPRPVYLPGLLLRGRLIEFMQEEGLEEHLHRWSLWADEERRYALLKSVGMGSGKDS